MSGQNLPWLPTQTKGLQMRKYPNRTTYRFRKRIAGKLHVVSFSGFSEENSRILATHLQNASPDSWKNVEYNFWLSLLFQKTNCVIYSLVI